MQQGRCPLLCGSRLAPLEHVVERTERDRGDYSGLIPASLTIFALRAKSAFM